MSCESFAHLLMWMTFIECVQFAAVPPFRVTGIRSVLYVIATLLFSAALDAGIASSTVIMIAIYGLFLLLVLTLVADNIVQTGNRIPTNTPDEKAAKQASALDEFAQSHGLSGKEREILGLLATGAKRAEIEESLGMSEGTTRTHLTRMYRKLGVHSKGELLELLECQADPEPPASHKSSNGV